MFNWVKVIGLFYLLIVVYLWPLFVIVAYVILELNSIHLTLIGYVLLASLIAHIPLRYLSAKKLRYHGEFATRRNKIDAVLPVAMNMNLSSIVIIYLILSCNWSDICH